MNTDNAQGSGIPKTMQDSTHIETGLLLTLRECSREEGRSKRWIYERALEAYFLADDHWAEVLQRNRVKVSGSSD